MRVTQKIAKLADINGGEFVQAKRESNGAYLARVLGEAYDESDVQKITRYAADMSRGDIFPPIFVIKGAGELDLIDGHHRGVAAGLAGCKTVRAVVISGASDDQADVISEMLFAVDDCRAQFELVSILAAA